MQLATPGSEQEALLWRRYTQDGDTDARAQLLACHLPFARVIAAISYGRRLNDEVEFGDYLQFASVGLLEAFDRYDPARGVQFRTFASHRMQGAILTGLEGLTEKLQQIAARQRVRAQRLRDLKEDSGGAPSALARAPRELADHVADLGVGLALCWMLEGTGLVSADDAAAPSSYDSVAMKELRVRLLQAVDALPAPERLVVRSHYLQETTFESIADTLQLTRGRVSQIHKQALVRLRGALRDCAAWDASF